MHLRLEIELTRVIAWINGHSTLIVNEPKNAAVAGAVSLFVDIGTESFFPSWWSHPQVNGGPSTRDGCPALPKRLAVGGSERLGNIGIALTMGSEIIRATWSLMAETSVKVPADIPSLLSLVGGDARNLLSDYQRLHAVGAFIGADDFHVGHVPGDMPFQENSVIAE